MKRAILFLVLFLSSMINFKAPVNGRDAYTPILPGNALELKKLAANNDIATAKAVLESIGKPAPYGGPGRTQYWAARFKITQFLKGSGERRVKLALQVFYSDGNEQEPIEGNTYIVFIYTYPFDQIARAIKLLPANPETVKEVVAAIAAPKQQLPPDE
jgi:hypothetical protein